MGPRRLWPPDAPARRIMPGCLPCAAQPPPPEPVEETLDTFRREPTGTDASGITYYFFEMSDSIGAAAGTRSRTGVHLRVDLNTRFFVVSASGSTLAPNTRLKHPLLGPTRMLCWPNHSTRYPPPWLPRAPKSCCVRLWPLTHCPVKNQCAISCG